MKHLRNNNPFILAISLFLTIHFFIPVLLSANIISLPKTGETTCFDSNGNQIDPCDGTGQDGDVQAGEAWPNPRFTNHSDGTITDNLTGLMWTQNAEIACNTSPTWQDTLNYVKGMNSGTNANFGYTDWRLPNILEMFSLSHQGVANTATWLKNYGFTFGGTFASSYWTSTTLANSKDRAWTYNLYSNFTYTGDKDTDTFFCFWPVRAGQLQGTADQNYPSNIQKTGQTQCYDETGSLVNCSGTGQDGEIQAGVSWPDPRFTDNGNGTFKDNLTGIDWYKDPGLISEMTWQESLDYIKSLNDAGGSGNHRMPNVNELMSLMDFSQQNNMAPQYKRHESISGIENAEVEFFIPAWFWTGNSVNSVPNFEIYAVKVANFPSFSGNQEHWDKTDIAHVWPIGSLYSTDSNANYPYSGDSGEPVNTYTGELFSLEPIDLSLGGPMPLFFQRYYASYLARSFIVGDLGDNWRHNFEWRIHWIGNQLTIVSDKGKILKYQGNGAGTWTLQSAPPDIPYQVTQSGTDIFLGDPQNNRIYKFNSAGKLIEVSDGKGNVFTLTYYTSTPDTGKLDTVTDGLGRALKFTYTTVGLLRKLTLVQAVYEGIVRKSISFGYDATGDTLLAYTDARGNFTEYQHADTSGSADKALMTRKILPEGNSPFVQTYYTTADQYASGRVKTQTDGFGNTYTFTYPIGTSSSYSTNSNIANMSLSSGDTVMTDSQGSTMTQTHDADGSLTGLSCSSDGLSTSIGYDSSGRRNSVTDRLGNTTSMTHHDQTGSPASFTRPDGTTSSFNRNSPRTDSNGITNYDIGSIGFPDGTTQSFQYDALGNITSHTDEAGHVTTYTYNSRGQVLTNTNALGGVTTYTDNSDGSLATMTDSSSNTTTYSYDLHKRLSTITYADTTSVSYTYDDNDNILTFTDELNRITTYTYDKNNNLISVKDPLNNITTMTYNSMDSVLSITDPLSNAGTRTYDKYGRPKTQTDANNNTTTFNYDNRGRLSSVVDPRGNIWSHSYNAESVPTGINNPLSNFSTFTSDAMGRITSTISPLSNVTNFSYDSLGRMISIQNPLGYSTSYSYDARGLLTGVNLPESIAAAYVRNPLGQVTKITDPNNKLWQKTYDNQGRLTSKTDPLGQITSYQYDTRNRESKIIFPSGTLDMVYDDAGNLTNRVYSDGTTLNYTYDDLNRLTSGNDLTLDYDSLDRIIYSNGLTLTRDPEGRISSLTIAPGKTVTYGYNSLNLVSSITDWGGSTTNFNYDAAGRVISVSRPNGVTTTFLYTKENNVTNITEGNLGSHILTRDKNGQVINANRAMQIAIKLDRGTANYIYNAASQVSTYTYDDKGHLTNDGKRSYKWNLASRLTSYIENGKTIDFTYDGFGQRVSRTENSIIRTYVWNYAFALPSISVIMDDGIDTRYFLHTPDGGLLYSIDAITNERLFYHFDEMGNTMFLTNGGGTVVTGYAYGPYGEQIAFNNTVDNPFTWQGRYGVIQDGSSGLYYIRNRYYESTNGRFISRDKVNNLMPKAINPYQYALVNPLLYGDPTGFDAQAHAQDIVDGLPGGIDLPKFHSGLSVDVWEGDKVAGVLQVDYGDDSKGVFKVRYYPGKTIKGGFDYGEPTDTVRLTTEGREGDERLFEGMLKALGWSKEDFNEFVKNWGGKYSGVPKKVWSGIDPRWRKYHAIKNCCVDFTDSMLDIYFGEDWYQGDSLTGFGLLWELNPYFRAVTAVASIRNPIVVSK